MHGRAGGDPPLRGVQHERHGLQGRRPRLSRALPPGQVDRGVRGLARQPPSTRRRVPLTTRRPSRFRPSSATRGPSRAFLNPGAPAASGTVYAMGERSPTRHAPSRSSGGVPVNRPFVLTVLLLPLLLVA